MSSISTSSFSRHQSVPKAKFGKQATHKQDLSQIQQCASKYFADKSVEHRFSYVLEPGKQEDYIDTSKCLAEMNRDTYGAIVGNWFKLGKFLELVGGPPASMDAYFLVKGLQDAEAFKSECKRSTLSVGFANLNLIPQVADIGNNEALVQMHVSKNTDGIKSPALDTQGTVEYVPIPVKIKD